MVLSFWPFRFSHTPKLAISRASQNTEPILRDMLSYQIGMRAFHFVTIDGLINIPRSRQDFKMLQNDEKKPAFYHLARDRLRKEEG